MAHASLARRGKGRLFSLSTAALALVFVGWRLEAVSCQATDGQLASVQAQYDDQYFSSNYPDGFGIPLKALALLEVVYPSLGAIQPGKAYDASAVKEQPTVSVLPSQSAQGSFKNPNVFTLMLADANTLGRPSDEGDYRHFLENSATFGEAASNGTLALQAGSGTVVTPYAGPGPAANDGPHRYAWMLFAQPSSFRAPSNLSSAGVGAGHWYVNGYVSESKLGDLVAANFFTVENGHANFTPKPILAGNKTSSSNSSLVTSSLNSTTGSTNNTAASGAHSSASSSTVLGDASLKIGFSVAALAASFFALLP